MMFQKEMAERIIGKINTTKYGRLSILTNFKLEIAKKYHVSPFVFSKTKSGRHGYSL